MKENYRVLIPTDFTDAAYCAVQYGSMLASHLQGEVYIVHIVNNKDDIADSTKKVNEIIAKFKTDYDCNYIPIVRIGSIFEDIGDLASEINARMIVMGTHGLRGLQRVTGSHALKVITSSEVPFIIVQKKFKNSGIKNIVLPLDTSQSSKDKLSITARIANSFGAKITIFAQKEIDDFQKTKLNQELKFAQNYLSKNNIDYNIYISEEKGAFAKQLINYSSEIDADIIAVVNETEVNVLPNFFSGEEQHIIANEAQLPVLIMNPTKKLLGDSSLNVNQW